MTDNDNDKAGAEDGKNLETELGDIFADGTTGDSHGTDGQTTGFDGVEPAGDQGGVDGDVLNYERGPDPAADPDEFEPVAEPDGDPAEEVEVPADADTQSLDPPQRDDTTESGAFSIPNYAQDLIDFEFVLESHDDYLPSGVNGAGMIATGEKEFVGIAEVTPRSWSIHTAEKKGEIIDAYKSAFLATLDFPIQIVAYPTKFDISDHVDRLSEVMGEGRTRSTDSQLVNIGRSLYPNWLERFILENDMKQRRFYIVIPISADQINQFQNEDAGLLDSAAEQFSPLQPLADMFGDDDTRDISTQQCLRELDSRLSRVSGGLHRFDVYVERLSDRDEVMSVLYHYYNNEQPLNDVFPTGPYSIENEEAPVTNPLRTE